MYFISWRKIYFNSIAYQCMLNYIIFFLFVSILRVNSISELRACQYSWSDTLYFRFSPLPRSCRCSDKTSYGLVCWWCAVTVSWRKLLGRAVPIIVGCTHQEVRGWVFTVIDDSILADIDRVVQLRLLVSCFWLLSMAHSRPDGPYPQMSSCIKFLKLTIFSPEEKGYY